MKTHKLFLLSAVLLLAACTEKEPSSPREQGSDGVYQLSRHLVSVLPEDDTPQVWIWNGDQLTTIGEADNCGGYNPIAELSYNQGRLASLTGVYEDMEVEANYLYDEGFLQQVRANSYGVTAATFAFDGAQHQGHPRNVSITLNPLLLGMLTQMMAEDFPLESIDSNRISLALDWEGLNVRRSILDVTLSATVGISQLGDLFGDLGAIAQYLAPDAELPLQLHYTDTIARTFDDHPNPYYGLLITPSPAVLCANNVLTETHRPSVRISCTITTPFGSMPFSMPYPMEGEETEYTYQYDDHGWPIAVLQDGENYCRYQYDTH